MDQNSPQPLTPIGTRLKPSWDLKPLGELCSKVSSGATPKGGATSYISSGVSFIRSQNVFDHSFSKAGLANIDNDTARKLANVEVKPRDVLLNITGDGDTIARCCVVPEDILPARVNQHLLIIRPQQGLVPEFLQRYLSHPLMREYMLNHNSGGSRRALTKGLVESFNIVLPPVREQQAIAEILGSLDDKIGANTKLAHTLANLASAEFSRIYRQASDLKPLAELVSTQYGLTTSAHNGPGPRFLRVTDINKKPWVEWATTPHCTVSDDVWPKYKVEPGDILVARMADPGKAAFIDECGPEAVFASYLVRLKAKDPDLAMFIYYFLRSPSYSQYAAGATEGSVQKNMNARVIVGTEMATPSSRELARFNEAVSPLRQHIQKSLNQNLALASTRDALLPHLMSGTLRVEDAEALVSAS